jgi:hypothetical protein
VIDPRWFKLLALPLLGFIPGYLAFVALRSDKEPSLDFSETLYLSIFTSLVLTSWIGLVLAELGLFTLPALLFVLLALCVALAWYVRARGRACSEPNRRAWTLPSPRPSVQAALLAGILLVAGWLYARPAEAFLVLDDAGVYILSGVHLAETGELFVHDPVLADLPPDVAREVLFSGPYWSEWTRFWGPFFIWTWWRDLVLFGFLHLPRLWAGLFALLVGPAAAVWATPVFGLLGTAGIYFLGRRILGAKVGLVASGLLTLNFVQIWHARFPLSDMPMQTLLMGSLYLLALYLESPSFFLGLLGGLSVATLSLIRLESVLVAGVVGALFLFWRLRGNWRTCPEFSRRKDYVVFLGSLGLALAYATLHNVLFAWRYLLWIFLHNLTPSLARLMIFGGLVVIAATVWMLVRPGALSSLLRRLAIHWRGLALVGLIALICYLAFIAQGWRWMLHWLAQYWTWPGLLIALVGFTLTLARKPQHGMWPFLALTLTYGVLFILIPYVTPVQPWAMRRMVPLVMPALAIFTAHAILSLPKLRWHLERVMQAVVIGGLFFAFLWVDWPFLRHIEYQGSLDQLAQLASRFEPEALILFDNGDPSQHVTQPLAYLFHRQVFVLQRERPDSTFLHRLLEATDAQGKPMYLVLSSGMLEWHPPDIRFEPLGGFTLQVPLAERSTQHVPRQVVPLSYRLDLYRIIPTQSTPEGEVSPLPATMVEMGPGEYSYLRGGFYGWETMPDGITFRWTNGIGRVVLSRPSVRDLCLNLRVASGRPSQAQPVRLSVWVNGVPVGERTLAHGYAFETWNLTVPEDIVPVTSEVEIELRSDIWVPKAVGYNEDPRELGVMVDRVEIRD